MIILMRIIVPIPLRIPIGILIVIPINILLNILKSITINIPLRICMLILLSMLIRIMLFQALYYAISIHNISLIGNLHYPAHPNAFPPLCPPTRPARSIIVPPLPIDDNLTKLVRPNLRRISSIT